MDNENKTGKVDGAGQARDLPVPQPGGQVLARVPGRLSVATSLLMRRLVEERQRADDLLEIISDLAYARGRPQKPSTNVNSAARRLASTSA